MNNNKKSNLPLKHISIEWLIGDKLGDGSFGSVFKAKKLNGFIDNHKVETCAIKIIEKKYFNQVEIDVLKVLKPSYGFLEYYGYGIDENENYYIYMEYIKGAKSIREMLRSHHKFDEREIHNLIEKVLIAIDHLHHYHNIVHRDIKSDHILLIYDKNGDSDVGNSSDGNNMLKEIKLIDFGCSKTLEINNTKYNSWVGTDRYTAPEVKLQQFKASRKSDIYSFGCVLLEMLGGDLGNIDDNAVPIIPNTIPAKFKLIIQKCLVLKPNGRDSTYQLLDCIRNSTHNFSSSYDHLALTVGIIPNSVDDLNLSSYNHSALTPGVIPDSVKYLDLSSYNHPLTVDSIPNSVKDLNLSSYNHSALTAGVISNGVSDLNLSSYNHPLSGGIIPSTVKDLNLSSYNHSALTVGDIPNNVTSLNLSSYNHSALEVDVIPNSVMYLDLSSYNHSALTAGVIPNSVIDLNLSSYNHSALEPDIIPNSEKDLNLLSYNHSALTVEADLNIPSSNDLASMGEFTLISENSRSLSGSIPNSVTDLNLSSYNHSALIVGVIPNSVTCLDLSLYNHSALTPGVIPNSVKYLNISSYNNSALTVGVIPNSVTSLDLSSYNGSESIPGVISNNVKGFKNRFSRIRKKVKDIFSSYISSTPLTVNILPNGATNLRLTYNDSELTPGIIPDSVTFLDLSSYNHSVLTVGVIPNRVVFLNLSTYNHSALTVGVIPISVELLNLSSYNHPALEPDIIPNSVTNLKLLSFNHPLSSNHSTLKVGVIPDSVKTLSFKKFNQCINYDEIPKSVTDLDLGEEFKFLKNGADLPYETIIKLKCSFDFSKKSIIKQKLLNQINYPQSVVNLSLPNYNLPLKPNSISKSITTLELGSNFKHFKTLANIPSSVYLLKFGDPEFNINESQSYLLKIIPHIHSISKLIINNHDVSEELDNLKK